MTLDSDLAGDFVEADLLPRLLARARNEAEQRFRKYGTEEDATLESYIEDAEGEAYSELADYFTTSVNRNYALFDFIADAGDNVGAKRVRVLAHPH